jgi:hypothetical protein
MKEGQVTVQDLAQPSQNRYRITAVPLARGLAFRDIIPVRRRLGKLTDPFRLLPFSIGAGNRSGRVDDHDFGEEVIR